MRQMELNVPWRHVGGADMAASTLPSALMTTVNLVEVDIPLARASARLQAGTRRAGLGLPLDLRVIR